VALISTNLFSQNIDNTIWYSKQLHGLSDNEALIAAKEIGANSHLRTLVIICFEQNGDTMTAVGGKAILKAIKNHRKIEFLHMSGHVNFGDGIARAVVNMLKDHPTLLILNLNECGLTDRAAVVIAKGLKNNISLQKLQILQGNEIAQIQKVTSGDSSEDSSNDNEISIQGELELQVASFHRVSIGCPRLIIE
jgi:hypothetical protein